MNRQKQSVLRLMEEKKLVQRCLEGDILAQKQLYARYVAQMKAICMRYASNEQEAEDTLQEAFIRVFTKMDQYDQKGPLGAWIRRVVVNTSAEMYRRLKKHRFNEDIDNHAYKYKSGSDVIAKLGADELLEKIRQLPDGSRVVFNLYAVEGFTHREIGEQLEISENTSKTQYRRARMLLQEMIEREQQMLNERAG